MGNNDIKEKIPKFIKRCRTADEFRKYLQAESDDYVGRRRIITDSINSLIEYIEDYLDEEDDPFA